MTSFVIGKVIEPEVREITVKGKTRSICSLGLLVGRSCVQFDIFDDSKIFGDVCHLKDGETVLAIVGDSVGKDGKLRHYLNNVTESPDGLREQLRGLFETA